MTRPAEERVADALSLSALLRLYELAVRAEAIDAYLNDYPVGHERRAEFLNSPDFGLFTDYTAPETATLERAIQDLAKNVLADVGIDDPWPSTKKEGA